MKARHLPSVVGCLIGFGCAGCGAGVVPGMWAGVRLREPVHGPDPPARDALAWDYGSVYAGSTLGMLAGAAIGVRYARAARRREGVS